MRSRAALTGERSMRAVKIQEIVVKSEKKVRKKWEKGESEEGALLQICVTALMPFLCPLFIPICPPVTGLGRVLTAKIFKTKDERS